MLKNLKKIIFGAFLLAILIPGISSAAVTLNNTNAAQADTTSPTSRAMSVTAGGTDTVAFACVAYDDNGSLTVTGVTYGGVAMTAAGAASKDDSSGAQSRVYYLVAPPTGSNTLAVTTSGTIRDIYSSLTSFNGVDQTTPIRSATYVNDTGENQTDGSGNYTQTLTSAVNDMTYSCVNGEGLSNVNSVVAGGASNATRDNFNTGGGYSQAQDHGTGAATVSHTWSGGGANTDIAFVGFSIQAGTPATIDQSAFRFRNDDGSETTATYMAAENTNVTAPNVTNTRLRVQGSTTGNVASNTYQLEYKKSTDSVYRKIGTAQPSVTTVNVGAQVVTNGVGQTLTPPLPASIVAGDLLLMSIAGRCNGSTIANSVSNSWTQRNSNVFFEIGAGATDLCLDVWYKVAGVGETDPVVTPDSDLLPGSTTGGVSAQIAAYRGIDPDTIFDAADATNTAAAAATFTAPQVTSVTNNALAVSFVATADDNALNFNTSNSFVLDMSGASYDTTTGSDHAIGVGSFLKATAGAVTMPIWNESAVGNDAWVARTIILRPRVDDMLMATSANITASGEATTALLSVPGGKSFTAGRMQDDENPADAVDIAVDRYTELEWSLQAQSTATNGNIYTFRVTKAGTAWDTYTVTPQWTIGTAGARRRQGQLIIMH